MYALKRRPAKVSTRHTFPGLLRALFSLGEQGALYNPQDLSTLFQDAAGTTPVTAVGDPVGLMQDVSGNGNHASQVTDTSRPLLQQDGLGNYYLRPDTTAGRYMTISGSASTFTFMHDGTGGTFAGAIQCEVTDNPDTSSGIFASKVSGTRRAGTEIGIVCEYDDQSIVPYQDTLGVSVANGTVEIIADHSADDALPANTPLAFRIEYLSRDGGDVVAHRNGILILSVAESEAPIASNSTRDMDLLASNVPMNGRFYGGLFVNKVLGAREARLVDQYYKRLAGAN